MDAAEPNDDPEGVADPAVEQLQRAAQQMVDASRIALDAFEALIADRRRVGDIVTSFTDLLDRVGRSFSEGRADSSPVDVDSADPEAEQAGDGSATPRVRRIVLDD